MNTSTRLSLDIKSNEYSQTGKFIIKSDKRTDKYNLQESCFVTHKDKTFFYGGSQNSRQISELECDRFEVHKRDLSFHFVGGTCASNNNYILLCFPIENKRLCYKSNNPTPREWWQWFTYVDLAYVSHDSIALSSGKRFDPTFKLKIDFN